MASPVEWLPDEPLFHRMLGSFTANPDHVLLHDRVKDTKASCKQLLTDMLYMRRQIIQALPASMFNSRHTIVPERPFILVLAPGNYDFMVATFGILCCGAAFSSISSTLSPEEANHILERTNASCILVSPEFQPQASAILDYQAAQRGGRRPVVAIPIIGHNKPVVPEPQIQINTELAVDPLSPGALIFTSGTTGPPKGIVRPRKIFYTFSEPFPKDRVALICRPPTWSSAVLPFLWRALGGCRTEVTGDSAPEVWECLRGGGVTDLKITPLYWAKLMQHFVEHIDKLPSQQREQYVEGARAIQRPIISGDFGWPYVIKFWQELLGRPFIIYYGSSEAGNLTAMMDGSSSTLEGCIGRPQKGVQIKLSEGDHGELLVKSRMMFTSYLGDEAATQAAFDEEGYFRSGDFARLVGDQYVLEGRLSTDFIRSSGLWISLREVEARLAELPYISEAHVVSGAYNFTQQVSALVRLKTSNTSVSLLKLREDLQNKLVKFKLPTILRILQDDEEIPETTSGKVNRKMIAEKYFAFPTQSSLPPGVEFHDGKAEIKGPRKAWDWAGMM